MPKGIGYHSNTVKRNRRRLELARKGRSHQGRGPIAQAIKDFKR